ncbi:MAG: alpha/beta fold hydrolase [Candidatus Dormibacteria bacterium]
MYVDDHAGRDPATVWLHHGAGSTRAWEKLLPAAGGGRRTIAFDRRGFGRSDHDRQLTTAMFDEDTDDFRSMLEDRVNSPVHLIGHSDGGTVALLLAARAPAMVRSVAVVAVHVRGDELTVATLRRMGPPDQWPEPLRRSLRRAHGDDWAAVAGRWHTLWTSPEWEHWSIVDELTTIRCPIYVMHGLRDELSPRLHADAIGEALPVARISWVDTATHDPHRVEPQRFATELQSFWNDAEAGHG